jgi:hypothetical protein
MDAVGKNLAALQKTIRADDDGLGLFAVKNGTSAYGLIGITLSHFQAFAAKIWTCLIRDDGFPIGSVCGSS